MTMKKASKEDILQRIGGLKATPSWPNSPPAPVGPEQSSTSSGAADFLNSAFAIVARLVIKTLEKQEPKKATVFRLVETLGLGADDLLPVVRWMAENSYVNLLTRPPNGDWEIEPAERSKELFR